MRHPILALLIMFSLAAPVAQAEEPAFDLAQYRGKVVYLDFWASWCKPCRQSFPWMDAMQKKYASQGLAVVAVDVDEVPADGEDFLKQLPAGFTVIHDPQGELAARYQLIGMPSSFLIGRDGKLIAQHKGFYEDSPAKYEAGIQAALAAP